MKKRTQIKSVAFAALFTGILAVISQIYIPFVIPLTFQIFAVALCGFTLGAKWGTASVLVYIISGAVGLPVFSGFKGGFGVLFEATGGFILGFIPLCFLCGIVYKSEKKKLRIIFSLIGLLICHLWGVIQFSFVTKTVFPVALLTVSLPYFIKDSVLILSASLISENNPRKKRIYPLFSRVLF